MNLQKYYVIEELYKLSQKSDEIIDKLYSDTALSNDYYEEVKKAVFEILNNKTKKIKFTDILDKRIRFQSKGDNFLEPFFETKATIHERRSSKIANENSCGRSSDLKDNTSDLIDFKVLPVSLSNKSFPFENRNCETEPETESNICNKFYHLQKVNHQRYSKSNSNSICSPCNLLKFWNGKYKNFQEDPLELKSNFGESNSKPSQVENTVILSSSGDSFFEGKNIFPQRSKSRENLDTKKSGKLFTDEIVEGSDRLSNNSLVILDKTYVVSSGSSVENNGRSASMSSTFVSSCDSSAFSFGTNEHEPKYKIKKMVKRNEVSSKDYSRSSLVIKNPFDTATHIATRLDADKDKTSYEFRERLVRPKRQNFIHCDVKSSSISNPSLEDEKKISDTKPVQRYRLRSLKNKSGHENKDLTDMRVSQHTKGTVFEEKSSESVTDLQDSHSTRKNKNYRKLTASSYLPESVKGEFGMRRKIPIILGNIITKKEKTYISDLGGRKYKKNLKNEKYCPKQLYSFSAPVNKRRNIIRNLRPITPIEFVEDNRESLKMKAEEKRRQREIKVQKTKERRERLDQEREERIRLSQQRLKQRFQQHEEMLKQKTEKFKITSRNRRRCYRKKSDASTSSRGSKDRTKDNDDFCRNSINSGQKLSKEGNGYRDVLLEKDRLASLEGDVGEHPDISKKQNAIPVGCEKTPVEFLVSCDGKNLKNLTKKITAVEIDVRLKDSKTCDSDRENMTLTLENSCLDKVPRKNKYVKWSSGETEYKNLSFERVNHNIVHSKQRANTKICKKVKKSYSLRSDANLNKRKDVTVVLPLNVVDSKRNTSYPKCSNHKNITSSSETDGRSCTKFCFNMSANKTKKKAKAPLCCKSFTSNSLPVRATKKKCILQKTKKNKRVGSKTKTSIEAQEIISYEIKDSVDDSFEENVVDTRKIPRWATGVYLKQAIIQQYHFPHSIEEVFGILPTEPIDLIEFFGKDKPEYHRRTSSDNWSINSTPHSGSYSVC